MAAKEQLAWADGKTDQSINWVIAKWRKHVENMVTQRKLFYDNSGDSESNIMRPTRQDQQTMRYWKKPTTIIVNNKTALKCTNMYINIKISA